MSRWLRWPDWLRIGFMLVAWWLGYWAGWEDGTRSRVLGARVARRRASAWAGVAKRR